MISHFLEEIPLSILCLYFVFFWNRLLNNDKIIHTKATKEPI